MAVEGGFTADAWSPAYAEGRRAPRVKVDGRHLRSSNTSLWPNQAGPATIRLVSQAEHFEWEEQECRVGSREELYQRRGFSNSGSGEAHDPPHDTGAEVRRDLRGQQIPNRWRRINIRAVGWNQRHSGCG